MEKGDFEQRLDLLDRIRCYRFGVTDSVDALVKGHERNYGRHALWPDGKKGSKKHNKELRLRSEGYLQAMKDLLPVLIDVNDTQAKELLRFARWAGNGEEADER